MKAVLLAAALLQLATVAAWVWPAEGSRELFPTVASTLLLAASLWFLYGCVRARRVSVWLVFSAVALAAQWGAPNARFWLHRSTYEQERTVFDWGEQRGPLLRRRLDYLVQSPRWESLDEEQMRGALASGWRQSQSRFKQSRLDACHLNWRSLGHGFYYVWDSC